LFRGDNILFYQSGNNIIENCNISSEGTNGIEFLSTCNGNIIRNCSVSSCGEGFALYQSEDTQILNCTFLDNEISGISAHGVQKRLYMINCTIENTYDGCGFTFDFLALCCIFRNCTFRNNEQAGLVFFASPSFTEVSQCHFEDNWCAIAMFTNNYFNKFSENNFISTEKNIQTKPGGGSLNFMLNSWENNYYNDWLGIGPYHIHGFLNWDFSPMDEPYDYR
jgi:parallel beta-helix repeat protein